MARSFSARGWAHQGSSPAYPAIGISLGSGYQARFSGLSPADRATEVSRMRAAGVTWVRMDVNWVTAQPSQQSAPDFSYALLTAQPMLDAGMNVVAILLSGSKQRVNGEVVTFWPLAVGNNPTLTTDNYPSVPPVSGGSNNICPYPTPDPAMFAAYCGAAAAALGPLGVEVYEISNEPNLDSGGTSPLGLGFLSPVGYASLATKAYSAIHGNYTPKAGRRPTPIVLGGALAGWARLDYAGNSRQGASWPQVEAGAGSATITCPNAETGDQYTLITGSAVSVSTADADFGGPWPPGTFVSAVLEDSAGTATGYTVNPPPWLASFPTVNASSSSTAFGVENGYPPDVFLAQAYAAAGQPMFDALSLHPYSWPGLPANARIDSGGWAMIPELRQIMIDNGDAVKQIWFTEIGAPTGQHAASWPQAASTDTRLVVSSPDASEEHLGYLVNAPGLPPNGYVASVTPSRSWTVQPPTGLLLTGLNAGQALVAGQTTTLGIASDLAPGSTAITIPSGTQLTVWFGSGSTASTNGWALPPLTTALTADSGPIAPRTSSTAAAGPSVTIDVGQLTIPPISPTASYPTNGLIQGAVLPGATWGGSGVAAQSGTLINLVAPGVRSPWSVGGTPGSAYSSETQQAAIIAQSYPLMALTPQYVGPIFVYCWSDSSIAGNAGPFGLTRVDGSAKPALTALTAIAQAGGPASSV